MAHIPEIKQDISPFYRRIIQAVSDLARRPLAGLRILDLACAHGLYSIELASRGAQVLGIEGRDFWLEKARRNKQAASLSNVEFVQDDVRNLNKEKYGEFDIVLCLGILYHLDAPDVFDFINRVAEVCRDFAIVETHFAATPALSHEWRGKHYWGMSSYEHASGATREDKLKAIGASLDNERSFWFTQASLCNILRHVGFTSVYDCRNPVANLYVGEEREIKIWGNRITLAAIKGQPVNLFGFPDMTAELEIDWPEDLEGYLFESYLAKSLTPAAGNPAAGNLGLEVELRQLAAQADVMARGYQVRSKAPVVGPLIAWVRRNLTSHLREPYLDPTLERQVAFNRDVARALSKLADKVAVLSAANVSTVDQPARAQAAKSPADDPQIG